MTIPKIYVRATREAAKDGAAQGHFALRMKPLCRAAALLFVCLGVILLARCGGGSNQISVEIQPNTPPTVDESQTPCNAPNNLFGCQMITFTATVSGDSSNAGVTWNLSMLSTGCSGTGCGTLINQSTVSVTYVAPSNIGTELTGVMLQAVSITSKNATTSIAINVVLDPTFTLTGLQQCAVGIYCLPSGSNGTAYNSQQDLAVSGGVAPYTFIVPPTSPAPIQINAGGPVVPPFAADEDFSGGATVSTGNTCNTNNVPNPAPAAVYQTARTGTSFTYTIPGFTPGSIHLLRLHFCETQFTKSGQRTFNVSVNGTQVLTNLDIFAAAGGQNIAMVEQGSLPANSTGQFTIQFTGVVSDALVNGIEVEPNSCPPATLNIGTLPPGLTLNPGTGTIVGRPTSPTAGNPPIAFQFTVQSTDNSATPVSVCENFQITVQPPPTLSITTTSLPPGTVDAAYSASISTNGGVTPLTWTILNTIANPDTCNNVNGLLPPGLVMNPASGQISGIPKGPPVICSFYVQVVDSSLPSGQIQTSQQLTLAINAPAALQITSPATLPGGFVAITYAPLPLNVTGGVGPYTWTVITGQLPAGLVLAPDGTVSGTPVLATNPPTDDFFVVQVADSELDPVTGLPAPMKKSQTFDIKISVGTGKPNTLLNGVYTFLFNGFDKSGPVTIIGTVSADGGGNISGGEEDIYRDGTAIAQAPVLGVYSIGTDGRGTMELVATDPISNASATTDYRLVLESGGGTGPSNVRFFQDNSTSTNNDAPNATHGAGVMKPDIGSNFTVANFSGNYAFEFAGYESAGILPAALAGVVHADASTAQPTLTGQCDFNDAGAYSSQPLSGTFSTTVDAGGRGTGELDFAQPGKSQLTLHFVFYFVSPNDIYFTEIDTSASEPMGSVFYLLSGEMLLQQPGSQFTNASLAGPSVATGTGLDASGKASVFAGLLTAPACDGSTLLSFGYDQNDGGVPAQPSYSGITCAMASNGRGAFLQSASDTFHRADGAVGANWTPTEGAFSIASDSVYLSAQGGDSRGSMYWNGAAFFNDQFSQLTITSAGGLGTSLGPAVRMQSSGENYYMLSYVLSAPAKISLQVESSGVATTLGTFAHQVVPGDVLRLEIRGTALTALLNGTTIITATDSTFASGSPGISGLNTSSAATGDNWSGGALSTRVAAAYLTGPGQGFLIGSDTAVTTGLLELQSGGPSFSATSLEGGYTLSAAVPGDNQVTNVIGQVNSDGTATVTGSNTVDEYDPPSVAHPEGFLNLGKSLSSAYSVSASGRGTLGPNSVTGFPQNLILYILSPGNFRGISADASVNGHPTVYFFNH